MAFKLKYKNSEFPFKKVNEVLIKNAQLVDAPGEAVPGAMFGTVANSLGQLGGAYAGSDYAQEKKKKKEAEKALAKEKEKELEEIQDGDDVVDENSNSGFTGTPSDIEAFNNNIELQMQTQRSNERT